APRDQVAHLALAAHACGVGRRLWRSTVPPNPPSTRIATPPPISASVDPSPSDARERSARSTAAGTPASTPLGVAGAPGDGVPCPPRRWALDPAPADPAPDFEDPPDPG